MTMVAVVSGEVPYDGRLEPITAGVTYIVDGHELVRRFPHMFKRTPHPVRPRSQQRATAALAKRAATASASAPAWRLDKPGKEAASPRSEPLPDLDVRFQNPRRWRRG